MSDGSMKEAMQEARAAERMEILTRGADQRPIVLVLEGASGAGKTHHTKGAVLHLTAWGIPAKPFLHTDVSGELSPSEAAAFYAARRNVLVKEVGTGSVTIADGWHWSTVALAGVERDYNERALMMNTAFVESVRWGWGRTPTLPMTTGVVANDRASPVRMALIVLDAPDSILDERQGAHGRALHASRCEVRRRYRESVHAFQTSDGALADRIVPALCRVAVEAIRAGEI